MEGFDPQSLSVVVPLFNEEANVPPLVHDITATLRAMRLPFELIIVDDGSSDGSPAALRALLPETPELVVVRLRRNVGQSSALQAGFDRSRGDAIIVLDGDLQNDPRDIPRLVERLRSGADVVSGWRVDRKDGFWLRRLPSRLANQLIRWVTRVPIHDQGCSLKAYRREVVERLSLYSDMHRFIAVLAMPVGASIDEIPVVHHPRVAGTSKYGLSRIFKVMVDLLMIQMLTRFQQQPMRWFALLGAPFLIGAITSGLVAVATWGDSVVPSTVGLTLAFTWVSCLLAGLMGEAIIEASDQATPRRVLFREYGGGR